MIVASIGALSAHAMEDLSRPLRVSADGRYIMEADGKPFFWLGDTAWDLFRALTIEEADVYLDDRISRGFNVIQAPAVFGSYGTPDALDGTNRYGAQALVKGRIDQPNPRYFSHVDRVIDHARERGLRVALHPVWGLVNVNRPDFLTPERARAYGKWLAERYRGKGIVWVLGGDIAPLAPQDLRQVAGKAVLTDYRPIWDAMAEGIVEGDGGDPFMTYHPWPNKVDGAPEPRTSLFFGNRSWLDMNAIQSSHFAEPNDYFDSRRASAFIGAYNYDVIADEYWSTPVRPVIDFEPRYEHHAACVPQQTGTLKNPCWRDYNVRGVAYQAVFAGAAGHSYGHSSLWYFYDPARYSKPVDVDRGAVPWREALAAPGGDQMRHLKALMLSRPYFDRIPDQSVLVTAAGTGDQHIAATRDRRGTYLMVYLPQGQRVAVDLTKLSGQKARGWWFDPRTGAAIKIETPLPTNDRRVFIPPSSGEGHDWILVLDSERSRSIAPGAQP